MKSLFVLVFSSGLVAALALGQAWMTSYNEGLQDARAGRWHPAREEFQQAAANRPDDVSRATILPGSPTEPRKWRNGAPYSPNFLAAYSGYREALGIVDSDEQTRLLKIAAGEFETLLAKHEQSKDIYFFLDLIYTRLGDQTKRTDLDLRFQRNSGNLNWRVDEEILAPEELAAMGAETRPTVPVPLKGRSSSGPDVVAGTAAPGLISVPYVPDKFALVLGESSDVPFAATDVQIVRDALVNFAGYPPANVTALVNGSSAQIHDEAAKLASRVPQDGTVLIYYVGGGVYANGKDYLVPTDVDHLVGKGDLFNMFLERGGRVFAFFEVNRATDGYFGEEPVLTGSVAQMQATLPDSNVTSIYVNQQKVGLFAESFANVLSDLRSNRLPIYEFGWQLYNMMRRGNTGTSSGASRQIPTLPVLNGLAADARF